MGDQGTQASSECLAGMPVAVSIGLVARLSSAIRNDGGNWFGNISSSKRASSNLNRSSMLANESTSSCDFLR